MLYHWLQRAGSSIDDLRPRSPGTRLVVLDKTYLSQTKCTHMGLIFWSLRHAAALGQAADEKLSEAKQCFRLIALLYIMNYLHLYLHLHGALTVLSNA